MKIKSAMMMLAVVSLLVLPTAFGKGKGDLNAPENLEVSIDGFAVTCTWDAVTNPDAVKYSVVVEGVVTVDVEGEPVDVDVEVEIGTTVDTSIEFDLRDLKAAVLEQLGDMGYLPEDIISLNKDLAMVKVKGLDPSLPETKRQNNPFATVPLFPAD